MTVGSVATLDERRAYRRSGHGGDRQPRPWSRLGRGQGLLLEPAALEHELGLKPTPRLTTEHRVRFRYGGAWTTLAASGPAEVRPRIIRQRRRDPLRRGVVYRFSGRTVPAWPGARLSSSPTWRFLVPGLSWEHDTDERDGHWTSRRFGREGGDIPPAREHRSHARTWRIVEPHRDRGDPLTSRPRNGHLSPSAAYSHSMVVGGLLDMS